MVVVMCGRGNGDDDDRNVLVGAAVTVHSCTCMGALQSTTPSLPANTCHHHQAKAHAISFCTLGGRSMSKYLASKSADSAIPVFFECCIALPSSLHHSNHNIIKSQSPLPVPYRSNHLSTIPQMPRKRTVGVQDPFSSVFFRFFCSHMGHSFVETLHFWQSLSFEEESKNQARVRVCQHFLSLLQHLLMTVRGTNHLCLLSECLTSVGCCCHH